jgi:hypothetical protein
MGVPVGGQWRGLCTVRCISSWEATADGALQQHVIGCLLSQVCPDLLPLPVLLVLLPLAGLGCWGLVVTQDFRRAGLYAAVLVACSDRFVLCCCCLQHLDAGDLVVTQGFKGARLYARLYAAVPLACSHRSVLCCRHLQDLDAGDLVVTQDFKGAGLYAAVPDPDTRPFMQLKKCGRDSAGDEMDCQNPFLACVHGCRGEALGTVPAAKY